MIDDGPPKLSIAFTAEEWDRKRPLVDLRNRERSIWGSFFEAS